MPKLHVQGLVEAELGTDGGKLFGSGVRPRHEAGRIARHHAHRHEDRDEDAEQHGNEKQQPPHEQGAHRVTAILLKARSIAGRFCESGDVTPRVWRPGAGTARVVSCRRRSRPTHESSAPRTKALVADTPPLGMGVERILPGALRRQANHAGGPDVRAVNRSHERHYLLIDASLTTAPPNGIT
jgi:hypothetical protein